jgi:Putative bacterial sensory transduction regulator
MSIAPRASACVPADVEAWLDDLGLEPIERADREGVVSWDVILDGRRRAALRVTLILDPSLALICWAHFAPPINDSFRRSYRMLLRWNDELPFVKFSVGEDERPLLIAEIPVADARRDVLGLALARQLAVADRLRDETVSWLKAGGWPTAPADGLDGPGLGLLERYAADLGELAVADPAVADAAVADPAVAAPGARPAGGGDR